MRLRRRRRQRVRRPAGPPPRPPQLRARLGAGPPRSLPGALPGEHRGSASRPGGLGGWSRAPSCQPRPRSPWGPGLAAGPPPPLNLTRAETAQSPVGWGGRLWVRTRWPRLRTARCAGRGNGYSAATVGGGHGGTGRVEVEGF